LKEWLAGIHSWKDGVKKGQAIMGTEGRLLSTFLIDDNRSNNRPATNTIGRYSLLKGVSNLSEALNQLHTLNAQPSAQIDIILCDINMWDEERPADNQLPNLGFTNGGCAPTFGLNTLEGGLADSSFHPYGPILALPFARFFRNGGIISPISQYWTDDRLMNDRWINGYVFAALSLIWGQADRGFQVSDFGPKYEQHAFEGNGVKREKNPGRIDIVAEFFKGVKARREQLYMSAHRLPDISKTNSIVSLLALPEVSMWFRGADGGLYEDRVKTLSLYADLFEKTETSQSKAGREGIERELNSILQEEMKTFGEKKFDEDTVFKFCAEFIVRDKRVTTGMNFVEKYGDAHSFVGAKLSSDLPVVNRSPTESPYYVRRYLLLFAQLQLKADGKTGRNSEVLSILGLSPGEHAIRRFLDLPESNEDRTQSPGWSDWIKPPFNECGITPRGWEEYKLLKRPKACTPRLTDIDKKFARKFWTYIGKRTALPIGLDST
jgi:hypothetical protein